MPDVFSKRNNLVIMMNTFTTSTIISQAVSEEFVFPTMYNDYKEQRIGQ